LKSESFGEEVYEGLWNGTPVACKIIQREKSLNTELELLQNLNHPNVGRVYGAFDDEVHTYLVMELCTKGMLNTFLSQPTTQENLKLRDLLNIIIDVCNGMIYLSEQNIIHRNLGARNIFATEFAGKITAKVIGFGLSPEITNISFESTLPVKWSPPEVIEHSEFTTKSDVWSFGISIWEILEFGKVPYVEMSNEETTVNVLKGFRLPCPSNSSPQLYQVMTSCWEHDPNKRPSFKEIHSMLLAALNSLDTPSLISFGEQQL